MKDYFRNNILKYDVVDSTNDELCKLAKNGVADKTVLTARMQSRGKGSHGREWLSDDEGDIYASALIRISDIENGINQEVLSTVFSQACALAVACSIEEYIERKVYIKWPNDLLLADKKICGILSEYHKDKNGDFVIVGFGINVNRERMPEELKRKASSIKLSTGKTIDTDNLLEAILSNLDIVVESCVEHGNLECILSQMNDRLAGKGGYHNLSQGRRTRKVRIKEFCSDGSLLIVNDKTCLEKVYAGEFDFYME